MKSFFRKKSTKAFTLIEVIMAISIAGLLLVAATTYLFSLTQIWGDTQKDQYFTHHAEGVSRFLDQLFDEAQYLDSEPVKWAPLPGASPFDPPLLQFSLPGNPALLYWEGRPLGGVTCYLYFNETEGLELIWYSELEKIESPSDMHRTLISPIVKNITYCNYDPDFEQWEESREPILDRQGNRKVPNALKLTFKYEDEEKVQTFNIPTEEASVPIF